MHHNKKYFLMLVTTLVLVGLAIFYFLNLNQSYSCKMNGFVRGSILVVFREGTSATQSREVVEALGAKIVKDYSSLNAFELGVPVLLEKSYIKKFQNNSSVESAETNKCLTINS